MTTKKILVLIIENTNAFQSLLSFMHNKKNQKCAFRVLKVLYSSARGCQERFFFCGIRDDDD